MNELVGKSHTFEDGDSITVMQIKRRDDGDWVTYHTQRGPGIAQKLTLPIAEFLEFYGHLFGTKTDDIPVGRRE